MLSLISASQRYADSLQTSPSASFSEFLIWSLVIWSYWALVTTLIFRLGEKVPLSKERLGSATLIHFTLSVLLGLSHIAFLALMVLLVGPSRPGAQWAEIKRLYPSIPLALATFADTRSYISEDSSTEFDRALSNFLSGLAPAAS